ncbi:dehydrogenase/reductase SDR family member 7 isoform X1 [Pangasianodon hypophthalmus]|uniref:dehydrogenase/reductase SDR family member 7 isoform X1 n=1 Tax=Pangasianodon hypophthalmus TaxID=310915 RepID=UPI0023082C37|nr:dehydrogenase/reductase SDR family member 7 isoform X1 [Pangasianodon hypophthalmus]
MEVCVCSVLLVCVCVYVTLQLIRFITADADFTLLWAAAVGKSPGVALRQKVVWITGASSGIGEELAYQLAAVGARLVLSARRENELHRVRRKCLELSSLEDKDILVLPLDLLDRSTHGEKTDAVLQHFGKIDVLVNNGGRSQRSLFIDTDIDVFGSLMELNYLGTISVTQHVLRHMIHHGDGIIATVSSIVGLVGAPLSTGYSASKHALQGFFKSLTTELTEYPNITISTICPGPVVSQIVHNAFTEQVDKPVSMAGDQTHKMSTERCVRLILAGLSNRVKEMWIAQQPFLLFFYLWQYTPTLAWYITNLLGRKRVQNFRAGLDADAAYFTKLKAKSS